MRKHCLEITVIQTVAVARRKWEKEKYKPQRLEDLKGASAFASSARAHRCAMQHLCARRAGKHYSGIC
jgi:hypothetical protein